MTGPRLDLLVSDDCPTESGESTWRLQGLPTMERYELLYELGRGAHGVVYAADDTRLRRLVAVKIFNTSTSRTQIDAEASTLAQVVHPHVVALHDMGYQGELTYLVMDAVLGGTLREQAGTSQDWREILGWCIQAARGLSAIHARGFVHNDIKPSNILVDHRGHTRVIDFGLSAGFGQLHRGCSVNYLAPERLLMRMGTPHSDQYSLARAIAAVLGREA